MVLGVNIQQQQEFNNMATQQQQILAQTNQYSNHLTYEDFIHSIESQEIDKIEGRVVREASRLGVNTWFVCLSKQLLDCNTGEKNDVRCSNTTTMARLLVSTGLLQVLGHGSNSIKSDGSGKNDKGGMMKLNTNDCSSTSGMNNDIVDTIKRNIWKFLVPNGINSKELQNGNDVSGPTSIMMGTVPSSSNEMRIPSAKLMQAWAICRQRQIIEEVIIEALHRMQKLVRKNGTSLVKLEKEPFVNDIRVKLNLDADTQLLFEDDSKPLLSADYFCDRLNKLGYKCEIRQYHRGRPDCISISCGGGGGVGGNNGIGGGVGAWVNGGGGAAGLNGAGAQPGAVVGNNENNPNQNNNQGLPPLGGPGLVRPPDHPDVVPREMVHFEEHHHVAVNGGFVMD